jgi:predicted kinase
VCSRWGELEWALLGLQQSFVSDATHPCPERRAKIIATAKAAGATVVAAHRTTPFETCLQWNRQRHALRSMVPDAAIRAYFELFVEPSLTEGFDEIRRL